MASSRAIMSKYKDNISPRRPQNIQSSCRKHFSRSYGKIIQEGAICLQLPFGTVTRCHISISGSETPEKSRLGSTPVANTLYLLPVPRRLEHSTSRRLWEKARPPRFFVVTRILFRTGYLVTLAKLHSCWS